MIKYIIYSAALMLVSCTKFLEVDPPKEQLAAETVFQSDATALSANAGLYLLLPDFLTSNNTIHSGLYSDELESTESGADLQQFSASQLSDDNTVVTNVWRTIYAYVYETNACIEGLRQTTSVTDTLRKQLLGEALFFRALSYYCLTNYFGRVPLVLTTDYRINASLPRTDSLEVLKQIVADLQECRTLLKDKYPTAEKIRVNRWAATAMLARVYLYMGDWANAAVLSGSVIKDGPYGQLPQLSQIFLGTSTEAILHYKPYVETVQIETYKFLPSQTNVLPNAVIRAGLVNAFEPGDKRLAAWTGYNVVDGKKYYYPAKYQQLYTTGGEYYVILRLAEQYLISAEANARMNQLSTAIDDLDKVRNRAGLPLLKNTYPGISQNALIDTILHERRIELFSETGHRWFDLKRTGHADAVMKAEKPATWKTTGLVWPIPVKQLETNPFLTPNPGYN